MARPRDASPPFCPSGRPPPPAAGAPGPSGGPWDGACPQQSLRPLAIDSRQIPPARPTVGALSSPDTRAQSRRSGNAFMPPAHERRFAYNPLSPRALWVDPAEDDRDAYRVQNALKGVPRPGVPEAGRRTGLRRLAPARRSGNDRAPCVKPTVGQANAVARADPASCVHTEPGGRRRIALRPRESLFGT